jgi:stress response protein YsnF
MVTLEQAVLACAPPSKVTRLEAIYQQELKTYERLQCGLPVAPAGKVFSFLPARRDHQSIEGAAVDREAETVHAGDSPADDLRTARIQLAERRMRKTPTETPTPEGG